MFPFDNLGRRRAPGPGPAGRWRGRVTVPLTTVGQRPATLRRAALTDSHGPPAGNGRDIMTHQLPVPGIVSATAVTDLPVRRRH
jgi:hypothetical protein